MTSAPSSAPRSLDDVRHGVVARMERADRNVRLLLYGAGLLEALLLGLSLLLVDFSNRIERLVFVLSVLSYTIIAVGLVALGAHVTRSMAQIVTAIDASRDSRSA